MRDDRERDKDQKLDLAEQDEEDEGERRGAEAALGAMWEGDVEEIGHPARSLEQRRAALGSDADHSDGRADHRLDAREIRARRLREMRAIGDAGERVAPAGELLVTRHRALEHRRRRHVRRERTIQLVTDAERDLAVGPEHVELRDRELGERVEAMRMACRDGIEPTHAPRGRRANLVRDNPRLERGVTVPLQDLLLPVELVRDALAETTLVAHLVDLDPVTRHLVRVGRPDALTGRAELLPAALALVQSVDRDVPWHQEMRPVRDAQVAGADAAALEIRELFAEHLKIHHRAGADDAERVRIEDARRHEMQLEGAVLVDDG